MNEDIDNLERELASLRPALPGEALRERVAAALAAAPDADPREVRAGDVANHGGHPKGPAPWRYSASTHYPLRRLAIAAGVAVAAVITFAVLLGRDNSTVQPTPPAEKEIVANPATPPTPLPGADASSFTWLAFHRAAAVSEEALGALLDEQARRMPAMTDGLLALRADLSQPN